MKKIPTLFKRDLTNRGYVTEQVTSGCEWVIAGEGIATRKWDGTPCLVRSQQLFRRYDAKDGRTPPPGFEPCEPGPDAVTGHWPGWVPVGPGPADLVFCSVREIVLQPLSSGRVAVPIVVVPLLDGQQLIVGPPEGFTVPDGTYELCGPMVNNNPEKFSSHCLIQHGIHVLGPPHSCGFESLSTYLTTAPIEGIVFYHPDGRMAKIKRRDFGLPWPLSGNEALRLTRLSSHTTRLLPERE